METGLLRSRKARDDGPYRLALRLRGADADVELLAHRGRDLAAQVIAALRGRRQSARAHGILAVGFVHAGTVLLRRICALIVIEHGTRRAHLAGITAHPDGSRPAQAARNFLMDPGRRAACVKFLIRDRASQVTESFDAVVTADGVRILASPPRAPRANVICEPMIGTMRRELFCRLIVSEHRLRRVLTEYLTHYNTARPHRTLGWASCRPLKLTPGPRRSTSPSSRPDESRSPAASRTSIRSPLDGRTPL